MRYMQINKMDIVNGKGVGVALFTAGCTHHCKGCFNSETWPFNAGQEWTKKEEDEIISLLEPKYIKRLSILGGEPLIERNIKPLVALLGKVKAIYPEKQIWLYTGSIYEQIKDEYASILQYVDILVDGPFVEALKDLKLQFRGSSNQRIINLKEKRKISNEK